MTSVMTFGHLALGVQDIYKTCDELRKKGAKIVRESGPMKHGGTEIAFIEDPNGYKIELIDLSRRGQTKTPDALSKVRLREQLGDASKIATAPDLIYDSLVFTPVQSRYIQEDRCHGYDDY